MSDAWWREAQEQRVRADKSEAAMAAMKERLGKLADSWYLSLDAPRALVCVMPSDCADELRSALKEMP